MMINDFSILPPVPPDIPVFISIMKRTSIPVFARPAVSGLFCEECRVNHNFKNCPKFQPYKHAVSKHSYTVSRINDIEERDRAGYCSAGIYLCCAGRFLAIREERNDVELYNLIGGHRDFFEETPLQTAMREFQEETGINLSKLDIEVKKYTWVASSKYILISVELRSGDPNFYDNVTWIPKRYNKLEFHPYANAMIELVNN